MNRGATVNRLGGGATRGATANRHGGWATRGVVENHCEVNRNDEVEDCDCPQWDCVNCGDPLF